MCTRFELSSEVYAALARRVGILADILFARAGGASRARRSAVIWLASARRLSAASSADGRAASSLHGG